MDQIESKKFLTESEKKETSWTDMKGKKHTATQVKGKSYGNQPEPKEVDTEGKAKKKVKEGLGIADSLMEEFGLSERVTINPDGTVSGGLRPQKPAIPNPYTGADAQKFASLSPEDQEWLTRGGGKPDINDPYILRRAPNKGQPVPKPEQPAPVQAAEPAPQQSAQPEPDFSKQDAEIDAISKEFDNLPSATGGAQTSPVKPQSTIASTPLPPANPNQSSAETNRLQAQNNRATTNNQSSAETARLARAGAQRPAQSAQPAARPAPNITGAGRAGPTKAAAAGGDPSNPLNKLGTAYSPNELQTLVNLMSKMPR